MAGGGRRGALKALLLCTLVAVATLLAVAPETVSQVASIIRDRRGGDITASGGTLNLNRCAGDLCDMTSTGVISGVTLQDGYERKIRFTGVATLSGTSSLILPIATGIITSAAGDFATFRGYASNVVRLVDYQRKDGTAVAGASGTLTTRGDLLTHDGAAESRIPISASGTVLRSNGTDPAWASVTTLLDSIGSTQGQVLYRGSVSWGALATGTSGHVLTTQGAGANPVWAAAGSGLLGVQVISASATYQRHSSATKAYVIAVAPGGNGGPSGDTGEYGGGGGGGAGAVCEKFISTGLGTTETVTVITGSATSFGSHIVAGLGSNGTGSTGISAPGLGGAAGTCTTLVNGVPHGGSYGMNGSVGVGGATDGPGGNGATGPYGGGGRGATPGAACTAASGYGGGGGGGVNGGAGCAGTTGLVIVYEYPRKRPANDNRRPVRRSRVQVVRMRSAA